MLGLGCYAEQTRPNVFGRSGDANHHCSRISNDIFPVFVGMGMTIFATTSLDTSFGRLLASIALIGLVAKLAGLGLRRLGQPAVIGEILVGIALGPSLLGAIRPGLPAQLFPTTVVPSLKMVSEIGLVLFMFTVGMEVDVASMRRSGRQAAVISLTSIAVPFALGCAVLAPLLFQAHQNVNGKAIAFTPFALFIGVSMCGTAFAVLARVLAEQRLLATPLGVLLMSCAAIDDVVAFALLGLGRCRGHLRRHVGRWARVDPGHGADIGAAVRRSAAAEPLHHQVVQPNWSPAG